MIEFESQTVSQLARSIVERHIELSKAPMAPQTTVLSLVDMAAKKLVESMRDQIEDIPDSIINSNMMRWYDLPYKFIRARVASRSEPGKRQKQDSDTSNDIDEW